MAKETGLGDRAYVGGYSLGGDVASLSRIGGGPTAMDVTGIEAFGYERIGGRRDGAIDFTAHFNPAAGRAHPVLSALPRTDTLVTYCRGATIGSPAACLVAKQASYDGTRPADGSLSWAVPNAGNRYGLEWGTLLTAAERTDTGATNGAGVDFAAGASFGAQFYLQVTAFTGTDVTITVQQSSDNGAGDAWAAVTGGAFTAVTAAPTWERLQTARDQTVERYLRVATTTTGGFTALSFVVVAVVNRTAVTF
jgi:hypothetical protein